MAVRIESMGEKKKNVPVIVCLAVITVIAAVICILFLGRNKSYRLLKIFEVEGTAKVVREGTGDIEPYVNMVLESGDRVSLDMGLLTIKADDDKYIYLEENTELVLAASGNSTDSKTSIELLSGAITNDIQNKLSTESSYEVNTPNSTMSVRGTIFYVQVYEENGIKYTKVSVFEGKVVTRLKYADGTYSDKEVVVEAGKEVIIYDDGTTTDYVSDPTDIDYSQLPDNVLKLLLDMSDGGKEFTITDKEIEQILYGPFTVTFMYQGSVFGTQTVEKGERASVPTLAPAASGGWDFDFETSIMQDVTIEWK